MVTASASLTPRRCTDLRTLPTLTCDVQTPESIRQGQQPAGAAGARRADCEVLQLLQRLQQRLQLLIGDADRQIDLPQAAGVIVGQLSETPGAEVKPAQAGLTQTRIRAGYWRYFSAALLIREAI